LPASAAIEVCHPSASTAHTRILPNLFLFIVASLCCEIDFFPKGSTNEAFPRVTGRVGALACQEFFSLLHNHVRILAYFSRLLI